MNYQLHTTDINLSEKQLNLLNTLIGLNLSRFVPLIEDANFEIKTEHSSVQGNHVNINCNIELKNKQRIEISLNEAEIEIALRAIIEKAKRHLERQMRSKVITRSSNLSAKRA